MVDLWLSVKACFLWFSNIILIITFKEEKMFFYPNNILSFFQWLCFIFLYAYYLFFYLSSQKKFQALELILLKLSQINSQMR